MMPLTRQLRKKWNTAQHDGEEKNTNISRLQSPRMAYMRGEE